ncbi:MAG TPA: response regulator transcription factor [Rhodocyclaceae bacterium]|nr:response regulator transcription factor [Rhodocyclaceae bacterium]
MIRVLMADDHGLMREGLKQLFKLVDDIKVTREAIDGAEVLDAVKRADIDLVLLDMTMPGINGIDLIKEIKAIAPKLPILVLSMHNEPPVVRRALKAGASGYLSKDTNDPTRLLNAIRTISEGGRYLDAAMAESLVFNNHSEGTQPHEQLSNREFEIFKLLAQGIGVNEIANMLYISNKTVSTHKCRLMEKMNMKTTAELIRYALDHKLLD